MQKSKLLASAAVALLGLADLSSATNKTDPAPIVVEPSQYWEGNDGPWSSFSLRIGSPAQIVRVLVSTAFPNAVVKINSSCTEGNDSDCANLRGKTFAPNASSTYINKGIFNLYAELNFTTQYDRAYYGFDTLGFGLDSSGFSIDKQIIASTNTDDYFLGLLGIDPQPTNFTNFDDPTPSLFTTLMNQKLIPSLSYSYTAGAQYRFKKVVGSLVFGGYDSSRFEPNDLDFTMADDVSRDLVVGLQSITSTSSTGKTTTLLHDGILALVDSTLPYIVLPIEACQLWENAFGLVYDNDTELYLVDDSLQSSLNSQDLNFTFVIGNSESGGSSIPITLPYASFDLTAMAPLVSGSSQNYFPLKRASNETQYTLGRTFLQEAVLIANYEQQNFSISQAVWNEDAQQSIKVIHPRGYVYPPPSASSNSTSSVQKSEQTKTNIGIGVGVAVGVVGLLAAFLVFAWFKRIFPFHKRTPRGAELDSKPVLAGSPSDNNNKPTLPSDMHEAPVDQKNGFYGPGAELVGSDGKTHNELPGSGGFNGAKGAELAGSGGVYRPGDHDGQKGTHGELPGSNTAAEVDGSGIVMELPGSPVPSEYYRPVSRSQPGSRSPSARNSQRSPLMGSRRGSERNLDAALPPTPGSMLSGTTEGADGSGRHGSYLASPVSEEGRRGRGSQGSRGVSPGGMGGGGLRGDEGEVGRNHF